MFDNVLCVIPARAGSKGIPNKNLKRIDGLPLFMFSVEQALKAGIPAHNIVVSSDSDEILDIALSRKVFPHRRPDDISGDTASTESAMTDVLRTYGREQHDTILLLQPTSPIRFQGRVEQCLVDFSKSGRSSMLTCTKMANLFWQEVYDNVLNRWSWASSYAPTSRLRKQDMVRSSFKYFDNGNIYITSKSAFNEIQCRTQYNPHICLISAAESLQIDTPEEFECVSKLINGGILNTHISKESS